MSVDKEYFVKDRILFCNSVFAAEGYEPQIGVSWRDIPKDHAKMFIELDFIKCGNISDIKGHSCIRTNSGQDFVINVPFNELVKIKYGIEL